MREYKKFIIVKIAEHDQELMCVVKQPNEMYPDGGLGLRLYAFGRDLEWPKDFKLSYERSDDEKNILMKLVQYENRKFYMMRVIPIRGDKIVDEDDDLYTLVQRYIYGNNYA